MSNDTTLPVKRCSRCGETRDRSQFNRRSRSPDGLQAWCRECDHAAARTRRQENQQAEADRGRRWRAANPERARAAGRRQYAANPEVRRDSSRRYRLRNPGKTAEQWSKWSAANPDHQARRNERELRRRIAAAGRPPGDSCECCGGPANGPGSRFHWDHDHSSGLFRGWICMRCNVALGLVRDSVEVLHLMINYLEKGGGNAEEARQAST